MPPVATAAVAIALVADVLVAEFPPQVHPVALFGRVAGAVDRPWRRPRLVGAVVALVLPLAAAAVSGGLVAVAMDWSPVAAAVVAGLALFSTTSLGMLLSTAREVIETTESDVGRARAEVRALVGRDAAALSAGELRSAAVESVGENIADGLVGPLLAFALGAQLSVAAAVAAAAWVKAVNTLDSMLGYETKPVGWASARLDDVVMWIPARLAAVLIAVAARDGGALPRARADARAPASPNSGWPMGTLAAALDVRLQKPGAYALNAGRELPSVAQARRGVRIAGIAGLLAFLGAGVVAWS